MSWSGSAAHRGARVIATASRDERPRALGAAHVLDYREPDWPERVRALGGVDAAVNAARSGSADAVRAVRDGGRLATITADLPPAERGIALSDIVVVPDGARLARLVPMLAAGAITVGASYPLAEAAAAMARLRQGTHGAAVVLEPEQAESRHVNTPSPVLRQTGQVAVQLCIAHSAIGGRLLVSRSWSRPWDICPKRTISNLRTRVGDGMYGFHGSYGLVG